LVPFLYQSEANDMPLEPQGRIDRCAGMKMSETGVIYTSFPKKEEDLSNGHCNFTGLSAA